MLFLTYLSPDNPVHSDSYHDPRIKVGLYDRRTNRFVKYRWMTDSTWKLLNDELQKTDRRYIWLAIRQGSLNLSSG